jgi:hypothetical protein
VRLRAVGSMQVRCADPGLLIAQFVGLPFDQVNDGILRSCSRSVERMLARLLTRRVIMANTPIVVTDPSMLPQIMEELVAYNPTAGAVFGVELIRMGHLTVLADDGQTPYLELPRTNGYHREITPQRNPRMSSPPPIALVQPDERTLQPGTPSPFAVQSNPMMQALEAPPQPVPTVEDLRQTVKGHAPITENLNIPRRQTKTDPPPMVAPTPPKRQGNAPQSVSGEINPALAPSVVVDLPLEPPSTPTPRVAKPHSTIPAMAAPPMPTSAPPASRSPSAQTLPPPLPSVPRPKVTVPMPAPRAASPSKPPPVEVQPVEDATQPKTVVPPSIPQLKSRAAKAAVDSEESRGSIMGIGMSQIGSGAVAGEIPTKVPPGGRVLVPGPNGLMQSATVRQLLSGYYELEVGSSGETIWVPIGGVVPD